MHRIIRDEAAAGTTTSFIVGLSVFVLAFSVVTVFVSLQVQGDAHNVESSLDLDTRAYGALRAVTTTPGVPAAWERELDVRDPERFGLLKPGTESILDVEKIRALNGPLNSNRWYEEDAKRLLGMEGYDFHLRAYPSLRKDTGGTLGGFQGYRVAYVAQHHVTPGPEPLYVPTDHVMNREGPALRSLGVDYEDATVDLRLAQQSIFVPGDRFPQTPTPLTRLLALRLVGFDHVQDAVGEGGPGPSNSYWKVVDLDAYDGGPVPYIPRGVVPASGNVLTASNRVVEDGSESWSYQIAETTQGTVTDRVILGPLDLTAFSGGDATLTLTHHVSGKAPGDPAPGDFARIEYLCIEQCGASTGWTPVLGAQWDELTGTLGARPFWATSEVDLASIVGKKAYVALAWHATSTGGAGKGWFVESLRMDASKGGVRTTLYENVLDFTTSEYDAVLVGSGVDQTALNDDANDNVFRHLLQNWVIAGGDLVVLGSDERRDDWLSPTFTQAVNTGASRALFDASSDLTHPAVTSPNTLQFHTYTPYLKTYSPNNAFTDVILAADLVSGKKPSFLSVSNANTAWKGTVVTTSYSTEVGMFPDVESERRAFLENLLAYARYDVMYLDWGGTVPQGAAVGSASRTMLVDASGFGLGTTEAFMILYVWR